MKNYNIISPDPTLQTNLMAWGFMCGKGWFPLIEKLLDELQAIEDKEQYGLQITEVKEKWGRSRVYIKGGTDEIFDLIDRAERESETICELCGKPGKLRRDAGCWIMTRCDDCWAREVE